MNKVIQAELKKTVSKPGIYILALLLAIIMVLGVFIYKPNATTDNSTQLSGSTVLQVYQDDFGDGVNAGIKAAADKTVADSQASIANYTVDGMTYKAKIEKLQNDFITNFNTYNECAYNSSNESYIDSARNRAVASLKSIYTTINVGLNLNNQNAYPIVSTKKNYDEYIALYGEAYQLLNTKTNKIAETCGEFRDNYQCKLDACINNLYFPSFDNDKATTYTSNAEGTKYSKFLINRDAILANIEQLKTEAQESADVNVDTKKVDQIKTLVTKYENYCLTYSNLINYELLANALDSVKSADKGNLLYLQKATTVNTNSWLIKYDYLFNHNKNMTDFANPLTIGVASNKNTNGYDYAYFILKMFSFVIIAYAIMAGAHTIAGEIKEGTMRYLAIRPVSRNAILFGKFLAIAIMSVILIVFSGIISILVGGFIYGFNSLTILTVFAGKYAITLHPITMIIIYLLSLILELLVYLSIAVMLSTFIKSDILAVTILMVVYLVNILLPMFNSSSIGWLAYYPFSHILLYSLFGSALLENPNNAFNLLLGAKVYSTTCLSLTLLTTILIIVICNLIASAVFKHKEI